MNLKQAQEDGTILQPAEHRGEQNIRRTGALRAFHIICLLT